MESSESAREQQPVPMEEEDDRPKPHKIFVTNLDVEVRAP